jgi:peptide/nickel transport system ATP-binding protein
VETIERRPRHPYTLGLLHAEPPVDRRLERLIDIPGWVPPPGQRVQGCVFAPRCQWSQPRCKTETPALRAFGRGQLSRCHRVEEIGEEMVRLEFAAAAAADPAADRDGGARVIEMKGLRKVFPARSRGTSPVVALEDASLWVGAGESVGLVGESGSGKTTLGRIIVGLEQATGGSATVGGVEIVGREPRGEERELLRRTAQMAFQDPYSSLNPAWSIGKTLREAVRLADVGGDERAEVAALLDRVGLPAGYAERRPVGLSGGERQRVAIARAAARRPALIVCDEIVSALDVSVQAQILNLLEDLRRETGVAYLFVTHDLAVVRQATERVYVLRRGRIVEEGETARVLDSPEHPYTRELIAAVPGQG